MTRFRGSSEVTSTLSDSAGDSIVPVESPARTSDSGDYAAACGRAPTEHCGWAVETDRSG